MHKIVFILPLLLAVSSAVTWVDCPQRLGYASFQTNQPSQAGSLIIPMTQGQASGPNFDTHTISFMIRFNNIGKITAAQTILTTYVEGDTSTSCQLILDTKGALQYTCPGQSVKAFPSPLLDWHTVMVQRTMNSIRISVDWLGAFGDVTSDDVTTTSVRMHNRIRLGEAMSADLNEFAVFYRTLTDSEMAAVEFVVHSNTVYQDAAFNVYIPFYAFDFTNVASGLLKGGAATFSADSAYTSGAIVGRADTYCSKAENGDWPDVLFGGGNVCRYRKELNKFFDYPTLVTDVNGDNDKDIRSGFKGTKFALRIKVPKHLAMLHAAPYYKLAKDNLPLWANMKHTFVNPSDQEMTDSFCTGSNWIAPAAYEKGNVDDPCSMVLAYETDQYGQLSSKCGFQSSQAGVSALAGGSADEVGVFGKAKVTFYDLVAQNCQGNNPMNSPNCVQTLTETFMFPFATYFKSFVTASPLPVTVFDEATAIAVTTSKSTTAATLDLSQPAVKYSAITVDAKFKTYVNWPYQLSLQTYGNVITSDTDTTILITPSGTPTGQCGGDKPVGFTGTCVQEWSVHITAGPLTLAKPVAGLTFDTSISVTMHVIVTNKAANEYNLRPFVIKLTSGDLTPAVTEHISAVTAQLHSCHQELTPANNFACPSSNPLDKAKFVTSSRQVPPQSATQTAYFAVVPDPVSKGALQSCQLLSISAFPTGSTQVMSIYSKKNAASNWGLEVVSTYPFHGNSGNDIWIVDPVNINGAHSDYDISNSAKIPACAFNFDVLKEYFTTVSTGSTSWSIQAKVFLQFQGETVIPQSRNRIFGKVLTFDVTTMNTNSTGQALAETVVSVNMPAGEKVVEAGSGAPTTFSDACNDKYPAGTYIGSCVGVGIGGLLMGAGIAWGMHASARNEKRHQYNESKLGGIQMSQQHDTQAAGTMEKHLAPGPTSSNAGMV